MRKGCFSPRFYIVSLCRSPASAAASAAAAAAAAAVSGPSPGGSHNNAANQSPIFLQFIDCVATLLRLYPRAFDFSAAFLVDLLDCVHSCRFGDFLCNNEWERVLMGTHQLPSCWDFLAEKRATAKGHHYRNPFATDSEWHALEKCAFKLLSDVLLLDRRAQSTS